MSRNDRHYEGSNHLGNVLVVFTDKRLAQCSSGVAYKYHADLIQAQHYSAFGAPMPGLRWYANSSDQYKFGFNKQEQDDEVSGDGNTNTAEFWIYDTRLGRRWNRDPIVKEWESPYAVIHNNPVYFNDVPGLDGEPVGEVRVERYGLIKRLDNFMTGNSYLNDAREPLTRYFAISPC